MRKLIISSAVVIALGLGAAFYLLLLPHTSPPPANKADQPISVSLDMLGHPRADSPVILVLTAKTRVPVADLELRLDLPEKLSVTLGVPSWKGALAKDEVASLQVDVVIPDDSYYEVRATAIARFPGATSVATDQLVINPSARPPKAAPPVIQNARGEPIIEFPADTKVY